MTSKDLQTNLEQAYYNPQGNPVAQLVNEGILTAEIATEHKFELIEVSFDGKNHLCIKTPAIVKKGPGSKFTAEEA